MCGEHRASPHMQNVCGGPQNAAARGVILYTSLSSPGTLGVTLVFFPFQVVSCGSIQKGSSLLHTGVRVDTDSPVPPE